MATAPRHDDRIGCRDRVGRKARAAVHDGIWFIIGVIVDFDRNGIAQRLTVQLTGAYRSIEC